MAQTKPVILQVDSRMGETRPWRTELRRRGARVLMADNAAQGLEAARREPPDLVLIDDDLDPGGEPDLTERFRTEFPDADIILLSSRPEDMDHAIGRGLLFHGLRPVTCSTLLELVEEALPGRFVAPAGAPAPAPMILCVDDDPMTLNALTRVLHRHGYRVSTFADPRRALAAIPEIGPDMALLDVVMPDLDGRDLSQQIRNQYRSLFPIVLHSARASDAERLAGFQHGADYFLAKPCEDHKLLDVVDYYSDHLDAEERQFLEARL